MSTAAVIKTLYNQLKDRPLTLPNGARIQPQSKLTCDIRKFEHNEVYKSWIRAKAILATDPEPHALAAVQAAEARRYTTESDMPPIREVLPANVQLQNLSDEELAAKATELGGKPTAKWSREKLISEVEKLQTEHAQPTGSDTETVATM